MKQEATLGYELGSWANQKFKMNMPPDMLKEASETSAENIALESAFQMIYMVFFASVSASFLSVLSSLAANAQIGRLP